MRDYAHKQGLNDKRPSSKKNPRQEMATPAWGWTILGIALGLGIAVLVAIKLFPSLVGIDRSKVNLAEQTDEPGVTQPSEIKTPPKPKFDFYTLLPNMEEIDVKEAKVAQNEKMARTQAQTQTQTQAQPILKILPSPKIASTPNSYILQAAVFQSKPPAETLKAALTLQGFDVHIEPYHKNHSSVIWYRVYLGPFNQEAQAKLAQVSLNQKTQVESFIIKNKA